MRHIPEAVPRSSVIARAPHLEHLTKCKNAALVQNIVLSSSLSIQLTTTVAQPFRSLLGRDVPLRLGHHLITD